MDGNTNFVSVFKALGDATRMKIVEMLSCGELCACDILDFFEITQPTLSYHMKILTECGLVRSRKEGSWIWYNNNNEQLHEVKDFWEKIMHGQEECICKKMKYENKCEQ